MFTRAYRIASYEGRGRAFGRKVGRLRRLEELEGVRADDFVDPFSDNDSNNSPLGGGCDRLIGWWLVATAELVGRRRPRVPQNSAFSLGVLTLRLDAEMARRSRGLTNEASANTPDLGIDGTPQLSFRLRL